MSHAESFSDPVRLPSVDSFEDGWDRGVDWANERADYSQLRIVQHLFAHHCDDLAALVEALNCDAGTLFGDLADISERHVEGFIDGAVAILREGGM